MNARKRMLVLLLWCLLLAALQLPQAAQADSLSDATALKSLQISIEGVPLQMSPAFDKDTLSYTTDNAGANQSSASVTASVYDPSSQLYINSASVSSGTPVSVSLTAGNNFITVKVVAADASQRSYSVKVVRNNASTENRLQSVTLSSFVMDKPFNRDQTSYTILVNATTDYILMSFMPMDDYGSSLRWNGYTILSGETYYNLDKLQEGNNRIIISVVAANGSSRDYTFTFIRPYNYSQPAGVPETSGSFPLSPTVYPTAKLTGSTPGKPSKYEVSVQSHQLDTELAAAGKDPIIIDADVPEGQVDVVKISLPAAVVAAASQAGKPLLLSSAPLSVTVPPGAFSLPAGATGLLLSLQQSSLHPALYSALPEGAAARSPLYHIAADSLTASSSGLTPATASIGASRPLPVTVQLNAGQPHNRQKLAIFQLDAAAGRWTRLSAAVGQDDSVSFELTGPGDFIVAEYTPVFADTVGHWAESDIGIMAARGIVSGADGNRFMPDAPITRAEFTVLLARALQLKDFGDPLSFSDVPAGAWYEASLRLVRQAGVISGVDASRFAPDALITREQMAVLLMNAYSYASGYPLQELVVPKSLTFADAASFSSWASRSIYLAASVQLMDGTADGSFQPGGTATRAQAVVVLKRLLDRTSSAASSS